MQQHHPANGLEFLLEDGDGRRTKKKSQRISFEEIEELQRHSFIMPLSAFHFSVSIDNTGKQL